MTSSPDSRRREPAPTASRDGEAARFVSIVIIARNEERIIERCISAAIRSLEAAVDAGFIRGGEVTLVDSASSDRTVERAKKFPITILQLKRDWPLSPAAGRQIGAAYSEGGLLFFIDGDTVVDDAWLSKALHFVDFPGVAAVGGFAPEAARGTSLLSSKVQETIVKEMPQDEVVEAEVVNVGLYRRDAFESVGGFQPFLKGAEDLDIALRLRAKGFRLLRTRDLMAYHHWTDDREEIRYLDYLRSVGWWSYGSGQAYRSGDEELRRLYLKRYLTARFVIDYAKGGLTILFFLVQPAVAFLIPVTTLLFLGADALFFVALLHARKGSSRRSRELLLVLHGFVYSLVRHGGFLLGVFKGLRSSSLYPGPPVLLHRGRQWGHDAR